MVEAKYPIKTTADEFARLQIQADLFREDARTMLASIGDGSGKRVLDLCCGIGGISDVLSEWVGGRGRVVGADLDRDKLAHARERAAESGFPGIEFIEANAFDTGFEPASFDLVHTRFALSVIENGLGILDHMLTLVRPGGLVFVEEVNSNTMECWPPNADWDEALTLMKDTFRAVGADTAMGLSLRSEFLRRGLLDILVRPCLHAQTSRDPMTMHLPLTLTAMTDAVEAHGLMRRSDLRILVDRVAEHLAKPDTTTLSFSMVQVVGRVPA